MPPSARVGRAGERVRIGSLEVHVAEHCNLRCRGCDVGSPHLPPRLLSIEEARALFPRLSLRFSAEVFKLVGGEPLLHPEIAEIAELARASGVGERLRLTTNGRLLHRAPDALFRALDEIVISDYASAPLPAARLAAAEARAARLGVRLRVKRVTHFLETLSPAPVADAAAVRATYAACWLRHCSPIVRGGVFYKCTRPAYLDELLPRLGRARGPADPPRFAEADGVPLGAPDFADRALAYLLSETPLAACAHCLGSAGPSLPHAQLVPLRPRPGSRTQTHTHTEPRAPASGPAPPRYPS